jgi:hypothetical protein
MNYVLASARDTCLRCRFGRQGSGKSRGVCLRHRGLVADSLVAAVRQLADGHATRQNKL